MSIAKANQIAIFKILIKEWDRIYKDRQDGSLELIEEIWNLRSMPSEDDRYQDAYGDIIQHYYRNDDITTEYLFTERLKLYQDDDRFQKFIEVLLSPAYYDSVDLLNEISLSIDTILGKDFLKLVTEDFDDRGLPVQKVRQRTLDNDLPQGVKRNNIPFYVIGDKKINRSGEQYFTLDPHKNWNDFSVVSGFTLSFYDISNYKVQIGYVKIVFREELKTWIHMEDQFFSLSEDFCSLSGHDDYYFNLKNQFGDHGMISVLYALQDAAYFADICDRFENNSGFTHSLIRENAAERMLRELRPKLQGLDLSEAHSFSYRFQPAYSESPVKVDFNFNDADPLPNRIFAVIGKNGTGKTQLMTKLPVSLARGDANEFYNKLPSFTRIIAVSYSVFDTFKVPKKDAAFNYVFCGLKDEEGDMRSSRGLVLSFHNNWKKIDDMRRTRRWREVLKNFIDPEIVNTFVIRSEQPSKDFEVSLDGFHSIRNKLSSGQSILLYIITQIVANIRVDSLILYDEPETHLHPNAIVELMNTIYELVNEFESYCLIATHSPLVIRELFSKNVFILNRDGNTPSVRRIGIESFGENLGVLSDEVFGDRGMPKQYKKIIEELIRKGNSFDQIVSMLEFDEVPLSLNARIYISNLLRRNNEEF
ncbi:AAA family ATPase [Mucilaginibacter sp. PAMB04274]|uniref:AbiJ-related protein n=1 Tax=Mucilaginibacter sp. PAMB04274 TaxID=3138568 RepID=UPI0031F6A416